MKKINYPAIQPLSKNTPANKVAPSETKVEAMLALLDYQSNFEELIRGMSTYDATSLIIAENDWIRRHRFVTFKLGLTKGQICRVDFGKVYDREVAYIHYCVYLGKFEDKYLVLPMTTNPATIAKAFHPIDNPTGEKWLRKAKPEEGFSGLAAIFMNDAKYISPGRVIDSGPIIDPAALTEIYEQLFRISLPELHTAREKLIEDLDKLKEEKAELEKEKATLEIKIMELSK